MAYYEVEDNKLVAKTGTPTKDEHLEDVMEYNRITLNMALLPVDVKRKLKALEIIKEKDVTVGLIRAYNTANDYNLFTLGGKLTEEEFAILKEEL